MILALALVAFVSLVSALIFSKTVKNWFKENPLGTTVLCAVSVALGVWAVLAESTAKSMVPAGGFALMWAVFFLLLPRRRKRMNSGLNAVFFTLLIISALLHHDVLAASGGYTREVEQKVETSVTGKYRVAANSKDEAVKKAKELALAEYAGFNPRIVDVQVEDPAPNDGQAGDGQVVFVPAAFLFWVVLIIIIVAVVMIVKIVQFCQEHFPKNQVAPAPGPGFVAVGGTNYWVASGGYPSSSPGSCANGSSFTATANTGTFQINATVSTNGSNVTVTGSSYQLTSVTKTVFQEGLLPWGIDFFTNPPVEGTAPTYVKNGVQVPAEGHPVSIVGATVTVNQTNAQPTATIVLQTSRDLTNTNWNTLVTLSGVPGGQQMEFYHVPNSSKQFYRLLCGASVP